MAPVALEMNAAPPNDRKLSGRVIALAACVVAIVAAAYITSFWGTFQFDDIPAILDNPKLAHLWPLSASLSPPKGALTVSGRPLLNLTFAVNFALTAKNPWSYHLLNLFIHLGAVLALFGITRRTLQKSALFGPTQWADPDWMAAAAAVLWGIHPLTTEAVTYVVQRAESLMGLFFLLALYGFVRSVEAAETRLHRQSVLWKAASVGFCLLGAGVKEVIAMAPLVICLYDRAFVARSWRGIWRDGKGYYSCLAATWLPLAALVLSNGGDRGGTSGFHVGVPWGRYWLTQGEAVVRYVVLTVWPHPLVIDYGPSETSAAWAIVFLMVTAAAVASTAIGCWRGRPWAFLTGSAFLVLAPTSLVPGVLQFVAEHRMYLPTAALVTGAVCASVALGSRWHASDRMRRLFIMGLGLAIVAALGLTTAIRNLDYRSDLELWLDTVGRRPGNALAYANVGEALLTRGETDKAIPYCTKAVFLDPLKAAPHYNLGMAYEEKKRMPEALSEFVAAARINPKFYRAEFRAGRILEAEGRPDEAEGYLRQCLAASPFFAEAHASLGVALVALGRSGEGFSEFQRSLKLEPNQAQVEFDWGVALAGQGRQGEAVSHYKNAATLNPSYGEAQLNLGVALAQSGRTFDALAPLQAAAHLLPDSADAHGNLGSVYEDLGRGDEAVAELRTSLRLRPNYPQAHYNLGHMLLRSRKLLEARAEFAEALRLDPQFHEARQILGKLDSYLAQRPQNGGQN